MLRFIKIFLSIIIPVTTFAQEVRYYSSENGEVSFRSEAAQEFIQASSGKLRGVVDHKKGTFVFKVGIRTFTGFNSALQQEHFNEKYLESDRFPEAVFQGKIIEDLNLESASELRAKGKLLVHGVEMERIIRCRIKPINDILYVESEFNINLSDHNIKVPKVVHDKIAKEIKVEIRLELHPKY